MIALLKNGEYCIKSDDDIKGFLIAYSEHIGSINIKILKVMVDSNEFTIEELIKYINENSFNWEDEIEEIYKLGEKIY